MVITMGTAATSIGGTPSGKGGAPGTPRRPLWDMGQGAYSGVETGLRAASA
jgi:hypothetical protein